jgi:hypothetical protein
LRPLRTPNPTSAGGPSAGSDGRLRLDGWDDPAILATGALAAAAGFAQFGATSALADVARSYSGSRRRAQPRLLVVRGSRRPLVALPLPVCPPYARLPETLGMQLDESAPD